VAAKFWRDALRLSAEVWKDAKEDAVNGELTRLYSAADWNEHDWMTWFYLIVERIWRPCLRGGYIPLGRSRKLHVVESWRREWDDHCFECLVEITEDRKVGSGHTTTTGFYAVALGSYFAARLKSLDTGLRKTQDLVTRLRKESEGADTGQLKTSGRDTVMAVIERIDTRPARDDSDTPELQIAASEEDVTVALDWEGRPTIDRVRVVVAVWLNMRDETGEQARSSGTVRRVERKFAGALRRLYEEAHSETRGFRLSWEHRAILRNYFARAERPPLNDPAIGAGRNADYHARALGVHRWGESWGNPPHDPWTKTVLGRFIKYLWDRRIEFEVKPSDSMFDSLESLKTTVESLLMELAPGLPETLCSPPLEDGAHD
jgi:hypothetical protein